MEDNLTLDITHSDDHLTLNAELQRSFLSLAMWLRFAGIIGLILTFCGVGFFFLMYADFSKGTLREDEILGLLTLVGGIALVAFLSRFALGYSSKIKKAFNQNSEVHLKSAIASVKYGVIIVSLLGLIGAVLSLFILGLILYLTSIY